MNPTTNYDVIIIGAGPSGIFCAYELIQKKPGMKILMVEKGRPIEKRVCPKRTTKVASPASPAIITSPAAILPPDFPAPALFPTASCPCPLMWEAIFRKSWGMIKQLNS